MTTKELKDRIEAKKHDLQARLATFKADSRAEAHSTMKTIKTKLEEIELYLKGGWEKVSGEVELKLHEWLKN